MALAAHGGWLLLPRLSDTTAQGVRWLAATWINSILAALLLAVPFLILVLVLRLMRAPHARRSAAGATYAALCLAAGVIVGSVSVSDFIVRREDVVLEDLPPAFDGLRIANLADVHVGRFIDVRELTRAVDAMNAAEVDLVVVSGDLIDDLSQFEPTLAALERSRARHGVVAVLGNHEKMGDFAAVLAGYGHHQGRIRLLIDDSMVLDHNGAPLRVVGVDYPMDAGGGHMLPRPQQDARMSESATKAFAAVRAAETVLCISHHPDFFPFAAQHGARLTLAGHTHGGQVKLFGRPVIVAYDHMQGRYRLGKAQLDVSAGFGHWLPLRIGVPRELVIVTLRAAA